MRKQYALQIDFFVQKKYKQKQIRPHGSSSSLELEDQKDTRTQLVFCKSSVACSPEGRSILKISHKQINSSSALIPADPNCSSSAQTSLK